MTTPQPTVALTVEQVMEQARAWVSARDDLNWERAAEELARLLSMVVSLAAGAYTAGMTDAAAIADRLVAGGSMAGENIRAAISNKRAHERFHVSMDALIDAARMPSTDKEELAGLEGDKS